MSEFILNKKRIIFNADFKPSLDFFQKQYEIMKELKSDFPDWELSGLEFGLGNIDKNYSTSICHNKVIYEFDEANDKVEFAKETILKGIEIFNKHIPFDNFLRLGLRFFIFIDMKEMKKEELADIISSKLLLVNDTTCEIFSKNIKDLAYILDYSKDEFLYHFKCGPMPKNQIHAWLNFGKYKYRFKTPKDFRIYLEAFPELSIFIDIDCYQENVEYAVAKSFINRSFEGCLQTSSKVKKYLLSEE